MRTVFALFGAALLSACSSGASSSSAGNPPGTEGAQLALTAKGDTTFTFRCVPGAANMGDGNIFISCNEPVAGNPNAQHTRVAINIEAFHGKSTYALDATGAAGLVQFEDDSGELFSSESGTTAGEPTPMCTMQADGPPSPAKGDVISATFHCENVAGIPLHPKNGFAQHDHANVEGSFTAVLSI
jgi:hypothetical protein